MNDVYVTGTFENYILNFKGYIETDTGNIMRRGTLSGSKIETEVSAIGIFLKYAFEKGMNVSVHSSFTDAVRIANKQYQPYEKRTKEYLKYISRVQKKISVSFDEDIPDFAKEVLYQCTENSKEIPVQNPFKKSKAIVHSPLLQNFKIVVHDVKGKLICSYTNEDFGNVYDALYFLNWYKKESKKPESCYYGCTAEYRKEG